MSIHHSQHLFLVRSSERALQEPTEDTDPARGVFFGLVWAVVFWTVIVGLLVRK